MLTAQCKSPSSKEDIKECQISKVISKVIRTGKGSLITRLEVFRRSVFLYLASRGVGRDGTVLCISLHLAVLRKPQNLLAHCTALVLFIESGSFFLFCFQ